ncbi:MAG TPA: ABC transporter substrate-binding protein [Stellaceae bacterium]|nr:ABC transporter substrate-binding protein [Stellaceae bacterium]
MRRRDLLALVGGAAASRATRALAQQGGRLRQIGILMPTAESDPESTDLGAVFRSALQDLGWTGGRNLRFDYRWGGGDARRIQSLASALVAARPDVILAGGAPAVAPLKRATSTIPIVFVSASDPVAQGFVASLAHPGGNITGFTNFAPGMGGAWLGLLHEIAPAVSRVGVLYNPVTAPYNDVFLRALAAAANPLGIGVAPAPVHDDTEIERAAQSFARGGTGGLIVPSDAFTLTHAGAVIAAAARHKLPAVYPFATFAANGGLVAYGVDLPAQMRQAAKYVDRILSGDSPGDLPVLTPTTFRLVVNRKTATALGLTVPPTLLARADEVIE